MEKLKCALSFLRLTFLRQLSSTPALSRQDTLDILFGTFFTHLTLTVWSDVCWCLPQSYILYNGFFLLTIIWSLHQPESEEAPFMALCINLLAIVFDIVHLKMYWPSTMTGPIKFGGGMAVVNLALRPFTSFLLLRVVQTRVQPGGDASLPSGFHGLVAGRKDGFYEDLDQSPGGRPSTPAHTDTVPTMSPSFREETYDVL